MPRKKQAVKEEPIKEPIKFRIPLPWLIVSGCVLSLIVFALLGGNNNDVGDYMTSRPKPELDLKVNADVTVNDSAQSLADKSIETSGNLSNINIGPFSIVIVLSFITGYIIANNMFWRRDDLLMRIAITIGIAMASYYLFGMMFDGFSVTGTVAGP